MILAFFPSCCVKAFISLESDVIQFSNFYRPIIQIHDLSHFSGSLSSTITYNSSLSYNGKDSITITASSYNVSVPSFTVDFPVSEFGSSSISSSLVFMQGSFFNPSDDLDGVSWYNAIPLGAFDVYSASGNKLGHQSIYYICNYYVTDNSADNPFQPQGFYVDNPDMNNGETCHLMVPYTSINGSSEGGSSSTSQVVFPAREVVVPAQVSTQDHSIAITGSASGTANALSSFNGTSDNYFYLSSNDFSAYYLKFNINSGLSVINRGTYYLNFYGHHDISFQGSNKSPQIFSFSSSCYTSRSAYVNAHDASLFMSNGYYILTVVLDVIDDIDFEFESSFAFKLSYSSGNYDFYNDPFVVSDFTVDNCTLSQTPLSSDLSDTITGIESIDKHITELYAQLDSIRNLISESTSDTEAADKKNQELASALAQYESMSDTSSYLDNINSSDLLDLDMSIFTTIQPTIIFCSDMITYIFNSLGDFRLPLTFMLALTLVSAILLVASHSNKGD